MSMLGLKFDRVRVCTRKANPNRTPVRYKQQSMKRERMDWLKALQDKIGEHPEIGQAIHKLERALASSKCKRAECLRDFWVGNRRGFWNWLIMPKTQS